MDNLKRRACDKCGGDGHESPCEKLRDYQGLSDEILAELRLIREDQKVMKDIIVATRNIKGWIATMKTVGIMLAWFMGFVAVVGGFTELVRHWLRG